MRKRFIATFAAAALALAAPAPNLAQSRSGQDLTPEGRGAFISMAGAIDAFEIRSGEIALEKARRPEVRAFAQRMVTDHRRSTERLKEKIGESGREFLEPPAMLPLHWDELRDLEDASDRRFDSEYVEQRIESHEIAVELHRNFAANGSDAQLKAFAEEALPAETAHLDEARQLDR